MLKCNHCREEFTLWDFQQGKVIYDYDYLHELIGIHKSCYDKWMEG